MKRPLMFLLLGLVVSSGCAEQHLVSDAVRQIRYHQDPRTGLCYAYLWEGDGHGGPALSWVPCDSIPPELLNANGRQRLNNHGRGTR